MNKYDLFIGNLQYIMGTPVIVFRKGSSFSICCNLYNLALVRGSILLKDTKMIMEIKEKTYKHTH